MASVGFFVTGTDTDVGKTVIACALLHAFRRRGLRVIGMKPVAAGGELRDGRVVNADVDALCAASDVPAAVDLVNPYIFGEPIAPHIAAARAGIEIDLNRICAAYGALSAAADRVIVEGAGGFRVPLGASGDMADLARALRLPVVVVVGIRLGCLNHALLTAESIRAAGLVFAGWVANHIDCRMPYADENVAALRERLHAPLVARVPYLAAPDSRKIAELVDVDALSGVRR